MISKHSTKTRYSNWAMGQQITVNNAASTKETKTFVLNRSLTGMENLTFTNIEQTHEDNSPAHVLSRRILKLGAKSVSVYSNVVTVNGSEEFFTTNNAKVVSLIEKLYLFYGAGAGWAPEAQN